MDSSKTVRHCSASAYSDDDLIRILAGYSSIAALSIDSPLVVPNKTGGRPCDSQLMRWSFHGHKLKVFATGRDFMQRRYGGIRGEQLASLLKGREGMTLGERLCETFPTGILAGLFPGRYPLAYKLKSGRNTQSCTAEAQLLLEQLEHVGLGDLPELPQSSDGLSPREYKNFEDRLDSVLCALNSYMWKTSGQWVSFGDGENCWTVIATSADQLG